MKRGGGVVPDTNYLLRSANSTLLQSLRRCRASPLYTRGPFWSCEHCGCAPCFSVRGIPYAPASGINLIFVGEGFPLPFCRAIRLYKTILCPLHNLFPYLLFLCRCRRKEKANKKKRQRGDAQEGTFYKKSPLDSLKNFSAADAGHWVCVPN